MFLVLTNLQVIVSDHRKSVSDKTKELSIEEKLQAIDIYIGTKLETANDIPAPEEQIGKFLHFVTGVGSLKDVLMLIISLYKDEEKASISEEFVLASLKQFTNVSFIEDLGDQGFQSKKCKY